MWKRDVFIILCLHSQPRKDLMPHVRPACQVSPLADFERQANTKANDFLFPKRNSLSRLDSWVIANIYLSHGKQKYKMKWDTMMCQQKCPALQ